MHIFRALLVAVLSIFATDLWASPKLQVITGVDSMGNATELWLAALRERLSAEEYQHAKLLRKPISDQDSAWKKLIERRVPIWEQMTPELISLYAPETAPATIVILLGNRAGEDAFNEDDSTIAFDLSALQRAYGYAGLEGNDLLMDRLFRHEFMHVMQRAWLRTHPWPDNKPLDLALLVMWKEGLGNYQSLSDRWVGSNGQMTTVAEAALAELEPRLVARLAALSCASADTQANLLKNISSGPFAQKWGALPVALWLKQEQSPGAIRDFIKAGPAGVWNLAKRHLPGNLQPMLEETHQISLLCS